MKCVGVSDWPTILIQPTHALAPTCCDFSSPRLVTLALMTKVALLKIMKTSLILSKKFKLFKTIFRITIHYVFLLRNVSTKCHRVHRKSAYFWCIWHFDAYLWETKTRQKFWMISKTEQMKVENFHWSQIILTHVMMTNMMKSALKSKRPCSFKWKCKSGRHFRTLRIS